MANRTETQAVESDVQPDAIFEILAKPKYLPLWAPVFADSVEGDACSGWQVTKDRNTFFLEVVATPSSRTVDYVREIAPGKKGGACLRVLPRPGGGSVVVMTLPAPAGGDSQKLTATLAQELNNLVRLSESRTKAH